MPYTVITQNPTTGDKTRHEGQSLANIHAWGAAAGLGGVILVSIEEEA